MHDFLWSLFEVSVNISEILMVYVLFLRKLGIERKRLFLSIIGSMILTVCTVTMNRLNFSIAVTPIISAILFVVYAFACFEGNVSGKILWSCVSSIIFVASNYIVSLVLGFITNNLESVMIEYSFARAEAMLMYVLINLAIFTILYSISKAKRRMPTFQKLLMVGLIVMNVAAMSVLINSSISLAKTGISFTWCSIACGLILLDCIGQVGLFFSTSTVYNNYIDTETELKALEAETKHAEKMMEVYSEIRKWKHDYNNQMSALSTIALNSGCTEVTEYIEKTTGVFAQLVIINTGNPIIDAVLSDKIQTAEKCGIHVAYSIAVPEKVSDKGHEISSIIYNLFDNAIEALQSSDVEKEIFFEMFKKENTICIKIKNPTDGKYSIVNGSILTTKRGNNHGYGLKIIKSMVKKCDGNIDIEPTPTSFSVTIIIPCEVKND